MADTDRSERARSVIITGASSGLGVAMAVDFGALGWRVAVGARRLDRLADTAGLIEQAGGQAFAHALDVADPNSVERFFEASEAAIGVADVVVNNAGMSIPGPLHEHTPEQLAHEVSVNLLGPMYVSRRAIRPLIEAGSPGDLIFVSSDASVHPRPHQVPYTATKAGLEGLSRSLSLELEGTGIRCTIVRPGPAVSEYAASWDTEKIPELVEFWQRFGLQRHGAMMPSEAVARAVVFAATTPAGVHMDTIEVQPEAPRTS
jgi:NAD(P)-dependent dehydrogenase (short-subunit alcohol dehydrogenase family)